MVALTKVVRDFAELWRMPRVTIDLMHHATHDNDPFFGRVVRQFYQEARRRHPKMPLVRAMQVGVSICPLPGSFDEYLKRIEPSARRNLKKAARLGYRFRRIQYNDHLDDVKEIQQSAEVRQGRLMPESYRNGEVRPCTDPPTRTCIHDYPYFGLFQDGRLRAYASCLVSGELCYLAHILGHAQHLADGAVPALIAEIARYQLETYPCVAFYAYGTYFGASDSMQRFKKKFGFLPHYVEWLLGDLPPAAAACPPLA